MLTVNRDLVDHLWATWSPGLDLGEHRARVHALYGDPALAANALRIYRGNFDRSLHDPELAPLAARSEAPAPIPLMVLAGADDGCIPPEKFTGAESALHPGSRVEVVAGGGHFLHLDRPDEVARLALEWFSAGPGDGGAPHLDG